MPQTYLISLQILNRSEIDAMRLINLKLLEVCAKAKKLKIKVCLITSLENDVVNKIINTYLPALRGYPKRSTNEEKSLVLKDCSNALFCTSNIDEMKDEKLRFIKFLELSSASAIFEQLQILHENLEIFFGMKRNILMAEYILRRRSLLR